MKRYAMLLLPAMLFAAPALADPWKDESGHGKYKRDKREFKEEYWDGNCKVERELKKDGEYKEKRECKRPRRAYRDSEYRYREPAVYVEPRPVYVEPRPVYVEPGVTIHGTVHIPR